MDVTATYDPVPDIADLLVAIMCIAGAQPGAVTDPLVNLGGRLGITYRSTAAEAEKRIRQALRTPRSGLVAGFPGIDAVHLTDSQRFQVQEARDILGTWDLARGPAAEDVYDRERVLADQVRALLALIDQAGEGT